jgi:Nif-specific regulatory protein
VPAAAKYHGALKDSKKQLVLQAMQQCNGKYIDAAKVLGIHPNSLLRLIRNLGLKSSTRAASVPPAAD